MLQLNYSFSFFGRGLWTWSPWVICAPAFNHKSKTFCIHRGFSEIVFLKKPHNRTAKIRIGQWKGYYMEHCGSRTPQPANKFKMADRRLKVQETQLLLNVAHHCSVLALPLQKLLCWKFCNFLLRNKALVYLLTTLNSIQRSFSPVDRTCSVLAPPVNEIMHKIDILPKMVWLNKTTRYSDCLRA